MARIRTIKPEFWTNEALSRLPEATHMLAAALLNYSDDEGYFNANPALIKAACSPLREPAVSIPESLQLLAGIWYLRLGFVNDGRRYGHVVNFRKHQTINRASPSKIRTLEIVWDESVMTHGVFTEDSHLEWNREQGTGNGTGNGTYSPEPVEPVSGQQPADVAAFPCVGHTDHWMLSQAKLDEYVNCFPALDVPGEIRKARQWLVDNPAKRKTSRGMTRFLFGWLERNQNRRGGSGLPAKPMCIGGLPDDPA